MGGGGKMGVATLSSVISDHFSYCNGIIEDKKLSAVPFRGVSFMCWYLDIVDVDGVLGGSGSRRP